ncbi:MAG: hypothetical protein B1H06_06560 [Candidatus Cloacimonas sp. 4484_143]|nr:MAG: hypothetical protein B1H06_06560 [Candidatus Cloacimonas sp. 4484_143]
MQQILLLMKLHQISLEELATFLSGVAFRFYAITKKNIDLENAEVLYWLVLKKYIEEIELAKGSPDPIRRIFELTFLQRSN